MGSGQRPIKPLTLSLELCASGQDNVGEQRVTYQVQMDGGLRLTASIQANHNHKESTLQATHEWCEGVLNPANGIVSGRAYASISFCKNKTAQNSSQHCEPYI